MRLLATILSLTCLAVLTPLASANGKKADKANITFHVEVDKTEGSKFVFPQVILGQTHYFSTTPELGTGDVATIRPFPADDGATHGATIQLNPRGTGRLTAVSGGNIGRLMLVFINGRLINVLRIDQMINDGTIVIWSGIGDADLAALEEIAPLPGESSADWKKRLKSK